MATDLARWPAAPWNAETQRVTDEVHCHKLEFTLYPTPSHHLARKITPHLRSDCPIVAWDPPATDNFELDAALHIVCHSGSPEERAAAWEKSIQICIQEKNGECLEWLSRHHATAEGLALQPDARLLLTEKLSSKDLRYVSEWRINRLHEVPIELNFRFVGRRLTDDDVEQIAGLLASATVKVLQFPHCQLTDARMKTLAGALLDNRCIETLNLSGNYKLGFAGMAALAEALDGNTSMKQLGLNGLESKGGLALVCEALKMNECLNRLDLDSVHGSKEDADAVGRLIEAAGALKTLNLMNTKFTLFQYDPYHTLKRTALGLVQTKTIRKDPIYTAIAKCKSLEKLTMRVVTLDERCATSLATLLWFGHITSLDIEWSSVRHEADDILGAALLKNRSLLYFHCLHQKIKRKGKSAVKRNLEEQKLHHEALAKEAPAALAAILKPLKGLPHLASDVIGVITQHVPADEIKFVPPKD